MIHIWKILIFLSYINVNEYIYKVNININIVMNIWKIQSKMTSLSVLWNLLLSFLTAFDLIPMLLGSSGHISGWDLLVFPGLWLLIRFHDRIQLKNFSRSSSVCFLKLENFLILCFVSGKILFTFSSLIWRTVQREVNRI